ncbi:uncharacterized protein G2W53_028706 [Senna tora]|uniref:Uncharacterized protein n=1 Tax=Senna tora TaxID=362788 RepID=A0A834T3Z4_9FABA|nr:uncharacterized protein G2W53_028706 [Senna tora]
MGAESKMRIRWGMREWGYG